jgi:hypothetical protein
MMKLDHSAAVSSPDPTTREGRQLQLVTQPVSQPSPTNHTLRANPYPEVTDLFCRLPLPTLFYQLEAVHLGDLLRLSVRPGTKIILSLGFSWTVMDRTGANSKC